MYPRWKIQDYWQNDCRPLKRKRPTGKDGAEKWIDSVEDDDDECSDLVGDTSEQSSESASCQSERFLHLESVSEQSSESTSCQSERFLHLKSDNPRGVLAALTSHRDLKHVSSDLLEDWDFRGAVDAKPRCGWPVIEEEQRRRKCAALDDMSEPEEFNITWTYGERLLRARQKRLLPESRSLSCGSGDSRPGRYNLDDGVHG